MKRPPNAFYAQSGGVTAVINASAGGVIEAVQRSRGRIGKVFAGRNGIVGALTEALIDTSKESKRAIDSLRHTPAGAFGSCRYKLGSLEKSREQYERLLAVFRAHDIRYFFYNGGGDSADTCLKVSQLSAQSNFDLQAVHIPKTIDNDLPLTDNSPGFGSVGKYVAVATREASLDVASMSSTSTKVFVLEVMGRHAGWIAAAAGLASSKRLPLPIVILFPEVPFDQIRFLAAVNAAVTRYGYCSVVVSEGAKSSDGKFIADQGLTDAFGHAQLGGAAPIVAGIIKQALKLKVHWAVADYLQRSAGHLVSRTDVEQAYAVGRAAVKLALKGYGGVMPTIERISNRPYQWQIGTARLEDVANQEKLMPSQFIDETGMGITKAARTYLLPLIQGELPPPYDDGLPDYVRLKNVAVPPKLAPFSA